MNKYVLMAAMACLGYTVSGQQLETILQKGHELAVLDVVISPDSNYVVTTSRDKSAKLWELSTGREVRSFLGHEASVTTAAFSSDGKLLFTGSNDKRVRLWEVMTGKELYSRSTDDYVTTVAFDPLNRFMVYAGYGDSAVIMEVASRRNIHKIAVNPDKGMGSGVLIDVSPDGNWMAIGQDNRVAVLYDTKTWKEAGKIEFVDGFCGGCGTWVKFSPDNKSLYVAQRNGPLRRFEIPSLKEVKSYVEELKELSGLALSSDGLRIGIANEEEAQVFNALTGEQIAVLKSSEKGKFHRLAFTLDSEKVLIASDDNTAITWDYRNKKTGKALSGFLNEQDRGGLDYDPNFYWQSHIARYIRFKNSILIAGDGKSLLKGKFGSKIKRWDIATGKGIMEYNGHSKAVLCYDLSADGKRMVSGGGDGTIILWDVATGDSLQVIHTYREPVFDVQFSSDEKKVLSSSWDGTMKIHDLENKSVLHYFDLQNSSAYNVVFHPTDLYVFTTRLDNSLQMWENDTKSVVRNFVGHTDIISSLRLSKDHRFLLSAGWDGSIRMWDVATGLMVKKMTASKVAVHIAIFSQDEKQVYTAGADRVIRVWDVNTSKVSRVFQGHNAEVTSLVLSSDNRMLISHSLDGVTKFWDLPTGKEFFEHIHLGDHDWLVKNNEGYFNGTEGARRYVHFVAGKKTFSVDQFFEEFYRPDLLPKIFQNRGGDDGSKGIQGKLKTSPPPVIKVALVPLNENRVELLVRMTNTGSGVRNLRIFHNGKGILTNSEAITYPEKKDENVTYKQEVDLIGGTNTFTAVVSNKENVDSDTRSVEIFTESEIRHSVCHVLAIGINEYKNAKLNLNYAKPDALSFGRIMDEQSKALFKNIVVHALYDKEATRENILGKLDEISREVHQEDVFVFYYAGHGSMVEGKFYFIPTGNLRLYDENGLKKDAIEASEVQDKLKNIRALKQLIVMDACQSGGSVELLATRGANEEKAIAQLSRSTGIHVLASAGSEQFAAEFNELGHGLFTFVLLKALEGDADGAPKDGKVTIYELKSYIDDQVPEMTRKMKGKPQYPYTFSRGQDFPVVIRR